MNKKFIVLPVEAFDPYSGPAWATLRGISADELLMLCTLLAQPEVRAGLTGIFLPNMTRIADSFSVEPAGTRAAEDHAQRTMAALARAGLLALEGRYVRIVPLPTWEGVTRGGGMLAGAVREANELMRHCPALASAWLLEHFDGREVEPGGREAKDPHGEGVKDPPQDPPKEGVFEHDNNAHSKKASSSLRSEEAHGLASVAPVREKGRRAGSAQGVIVSEGELALGTWMLAQGGFTAPPRGGAAAFAKGISLAHRTFERAYDFTNDEAMAAWQWAVGHYFWGRIRTRGAAWVDGNNLAQLIRDWREAGSPGLPSQHVQPGGTIPSRHVDEDDTEDLLADRIAGGRSFEIIDRERAG